MNKSHPTQWGVLPVTVLCVAMGFCGIWAHENEEEPVVSINHWVEKET